LWLTKAQGVFARKPIGFLDAIKREGKGMRKIVAVGDCSDSWRSERGHGTGTHEVTGLVIKIDTAAVSVTILPKWGMR